MKSTRAAVTLRQIREFQQMVAGKARLHYLLPDAYLRS
jgi:hypothetical protein